MSKVQVHESQESTLTTLSKYSFRSHAKSPNIQVARIQADAHNHYDRDAIQVCTKSSTMTLSKQAVTTFLDHFSHKEGQDRRPTKAMASTLKSSTPVSARRALEGRLSAGRAEIPSRDESMFICLGNKMFLSGEQGKEKFVETCILSTCVSEKHH
jgi:hypothetical protein